MVIIEMQHVTKIKNKMCQAMYLFSYFNLHH